MIGGAMEGRTMLDAIRRWLGATRRERELRALADSQARHAEELRRRLDEAGAKRDKLWNDAEETVNELQSELDEARRLLKVAEAERDAARQQRDDLACQMKAVAAERDTVWKERDEVQRLLKVAAAERDEARRLLRAAEDERDAIHGTRDAFRAECRRSARYYIKDLASRHGVIMRRIEMEMSNWRRIADEMLAQVSGGEKADDDAAQPAKEPKP